MATEKIKSLKDIGALRGAFITDAKAEALLAFIAKYQRSNAGMTPTYSVMANNIDAPEEAVRVLLARLENKGKVHFVSRNPPRIMLLGTDTKLPHEPSLADRPGPRDEAAYERFLDVEGTRMRLGRFIADNERSGRPTTLRAMMDHVGYQNAAYVARMAEVLAERGLLQFGPNLPTKLTERGRDFFGVKEMQQQEVQMNGNEGTTVVVVRKEKSRQTFKQRVHAFMDILAKEVAKTGNRKVMFKQSELAMMMGYAASSGQVIQDFARDATRLGYLTDKPLGTHGYTVTDKGIKMFGPQPELAGDTQPDPDKIEEEVFEGEPVTVLHHDHDTRFLSEGHPGPDAYRDRFGGLRYVEDTRPVPTTASPLAFADTAALILELVERGYTVRKG